MNAGSSVPVGAGTFFLPDAEAGPVVHQVGREVAGKTMPWVRLTRPFTLLPPTLGVVSGAITAFGSDWNPDPGRAFTVSLAATILLGTVCAALLNAASNVINQIFDLEIDQVNKPERPLVTGAVSLAGAWRFATPLYLLALLPTWMVVIWPATSLADKLGAKLTSHECFFVYLAGTVATFIYSAPSLGRTKAHTFLANLTIAVPRGMLLKVAGWSMVASIFHLEPWFIGLIFFLFLLGAASTKDFSDMEGDARGGCRTLPLVFGVGRAARMVSPFFVLPWLLMPLGASLSDPFSPDHRLLTGNPWVLTGAGGGLALWGIYVVYLILRDPEALARSENHPSWTHMYLMMMAAQLSFALAYLI
ncbi:MAG: UbiA family prenyltransferase [Acidobacteriota bacterium]